MTQTTASQRGKLPTAGWRLFCKFSMVGKHSKYSTCAGLQKGSPGLCMTHWMQKWGKAAMPKGGSPMSLPYVHSGFNPCYLAGAEAGDGSGIGRFQALEIAFLPLVRVGLCLQGRRHHSYSCRAEYSAGELLLCRCFAEVSSLRGCIAHYCSPGAG